tara:strand:- start:397 stop:1029 length:633 start_codon:yes stop_codon:yes gene_type:complete
MTSLQKITTTSALALALGLALPAYAQNEKATDQELQNKSAPQGQMESDKQTPAMPDQKDVGAGKAGTPGMTGTASVQPVTEQRPSQFLAGDLIGSSVVNDQGEAVGNVKNLAIDKDGKVESVVVSVGGFLGIGSKQVGLPWESMKRESSEGSMTLHIAATADELKQMPEFRTVEAIKSEQEAERARNAARQNTGTGANPVPPRSGAPANQ